MGVDGLKGQSRRIYEERNRFFCQKP